MPGSSGAGAPAAASPAGAPEAAAQAAPRPQVVREPTGAELVAEAVARWRAALVERAGASPLTDVERLGDARLDLSAAHPSGVAQLFAGRPTRLSNLVREGSALSTARRRARAVAAHAEDQAHRHGLASTFLAIGVATWTEPVDAGPAPDGTPADTDGDDAAAPAPEPRVVHAPVLLRPVTIRPRGRGESDHELTLEPSLEVNPVLATALRGRGALLDPTALARGAFTEAGFDPEPALRRLRSLGEALLPDFELTDRLLVGPFVHPEQLLVDDLDAIADTAAWHEVVRALAGDARSREALAHPLPEPVPGDRPAEQERGVGDLDPSAVHVLDALAAGHHLLVDAPPGSDVPGLLAAVVADAAAAGRTVLYVAGHRRAGTALVERLDALGLGELVLDVAPHAGRRTETGTRLLAAMTVEPVHVPEDQVAVVERELSDRRRRLHGYIDALHRTREPWGVSAYDALQALARLTAERPGPRTRVRLTVPVAESLTPERRAQATADLIRAAGLGAFTAATRSSPWYGARLLTRSRADDALTRVVRLLDESLPHVRAAAERVAEETGLVPARTADEWAEQLTMLAEVRDALDVFRPLVFERSVADLVAATATPEWREAHGIDMPGAVRRRLRKQAKDMVRPGRPVADLHGALLHVQEQQRVWQAHCPAGGWPRIPDGLADLEHENAGLHADLEWLSTVLEPTEAGGGLGALPWDELAARLGRLRADAGALDTLPERAALLEGLARQGLQDLVEDLAERRVGAGLVGAELDLAWWSAVFEEILRQDPALAGHDGAGLTKLVAEFRTLDRRHRQDRGLLSLAAARELLRTRLRAHDDETQELFAELVEQRFGGLRAATERYPGVARHLRPCLVASPVLVPQLVPAARREDLVILDAAGHLPVEAVVPALARGSQVLVVGDTRTVTGTALAGLAEVLPRLSLRADTSRRDPHLTAFLAGHGYADVLAPTPLPDTTGLLRLDVVDGSGMPDRTGAVESTQAEVDRVVELVVEHALTRPEESLAVVTASAAHATRVRDAVMAEVRDNPALGPFFRPDRPEAFVVADVASTQGLSREAIVLSLGFGRTPHGRVLHRFGLLSEAGGEGRLLAALGATRHRLTVVSCFGRDDLDEDRLRAPGARLLADLLALAAERTAAVRPEPHAPEPGAEPDRLVLDLAERLWRQGLTVELDHGLEGGVRLPLVVGHPDLPGRMLVAVLTDDDAYVREPSVRVRDRQVPERLERLGWSVVQVWSAAAFLDPQGEADAIAEVAVEACRRILAASAPAAPRVPAAVPDVVDATELPRVIDRVPGPGADDRADDGDDGAELPVVSAVPPVRGPRPAVERGLRAYTDDQLDELVAWIRADGVERDEAGLAAALREELGITRRGARIDTAVEAAVRRALG